MKRSGRIWGGSGSLLLVVPRSPSKPARPEGVVAGTVFAMVAQLTTAAFTAGVTLYLVRALGPEGFGELALVLSVGAIALVVADAAVAQSTARFTADVHDDPERVAAVISAGLRLKLALCAAAAVGLVALAGPIARAYGEPAMAWALRAVALAVVAESLMMLWLMAFQALRRISVNMRLYLVESIAEAAAIVSLVAFGAGVTGAVLGRGIGYVVGAVAGGLLLVRLIGRRLSIRGGHDAHSHQVAAYARPLFVTTGIYSTYGQVDIQLVGALLTRALAGIYAAPMRIVVLLGYPGQAVASTVSPRMAGDDPDVPAFNTALRWLLIYQTGLMAPVLVWAEPITLLLLGSEYAESAVVLAAMAPFLFLNGVSVLISTTVNYLGQARRRIPIVLVSLVVNVGLCLVLLPTIGVVGAAIALGASYALYVPLHLRICRECFDVPLRPLARTVLRAGVASLAGAAVLLAVGTGQLSAVQWLLGGAGGAAAFLAVLTGTGEITRSDLRRVQEVLSGAGDRLRRR